MAERKKISMPFNKEMHMHFPKPKCSLLGQKRGGTDHLSGIPSYRAVRGSCYTNINQRLPSLLYYRSILSTDWRVDVDGAAVLNLEEWQRASRSAGK